MKVRMARRLASLAAGAWVTLLVGGLFAPRAAQAGCAHYVVAHGQGANTGAAFLNDLELFSEAALRHAEGQPRSPFDGPSPCSGMSCSRNPMPPMAPVPAGPLRAESWACLYQSPPPAALPSLASLRKRATGRPVHLAFPPERPPRSV